MKKIIPTVFVLLLTFNFNSIAQCTWHQELYDSYEYQTPCPDVIAGTTYTSIPQDWAVNTGTYSLYLNFVNCSGVTGTCAGDTVYSRTFEVCQGMPNRVSAMLTTTFSGSQCDMKILIIDANSNVLSTTASILPDYAPMWTLYQAAFIASTPTVTFMMITNADGAQGGNDLSMDDFTVENCYSLSLGNDTTICSTESLMLDPGSFANYLWNDNSVNQLFIASSAGGIADTSVYFVRVTNNSGCVLHSDTLTVIFEICSGIKNTISKNDLSVFSNSLTHQVTIHSSNNKAEGAVFILYDSGGIELRRIKLQRLNQTFSLHDINNGIYFYSISSSSEYFTSGKVTFE